MHDFICPGCSGSSCADSLDYLAETEGFKHKKIVTCQQCDLKSIFPMPTDLELAAYYNKYWAKHDFTELDKLFEAQAKSRYKFFESYITGNLPLRVLDVGAGFGFIKSYFGDDVEYNAVEIDPDAIKYLKSHSITNMVYPSIEAATGQYDVIILAHIIEHFKMPLDFMRQVSGKLTDQGVVFVEVPNKDYLFKTRNEPHLIFFQPESLINLIKNSGFNIIDCQTCGDKIADLARIKIGTFAPIKKIIKGILPKMLVERIKVIKSNNSLKKMSIDHTSEYGIERQWIRLAAKKSKNSSI